MTRVVITGMGMCSPLGVTTDEIMDSLHAQQNKCVVWDKLSEFKDLNCHVVCPVTAELPKYPRKKLERWVVLVLWRRMLQKTL